MAKTETKLDVKNALRFALDKVDGNLAPFMDIYPGDTSVHNVYHPRKPRVAGLADGANVGWTTSFWAGQIWLAFDLTLDAKYRAAGEHHIKSFADRMTRKVDVDNHDLGFLYTLSCVAPWRLTVNETGKRTALQAADQLMHRFLDKPGIFQAWGTMEDPKQRGRTIIDSIMNMPLLYWASEMTGNKRYHDAAVRHASQLRDHIVRPDNTSFHTFYWDADTGAPRFGDTAQGAANDSCWSRGQAWGIYGFALSYAYTHDATMLHTARCLADYFISRMPADKVAYWDLIYMDGSGEERDSSAAAIAVCGMQEIIRWMPAGPDRERYAAAATGILASLAQNYTSKDAPGSNAILLHGVQSKPGKHGIDEASLWGDYYYLEALTRAVRPDWKMYW